VKGYTINVFSKPSSRLMKRVNVRDCFEYPPAIPQASLDEKNVNRNASIGKLARNTHRSRSRVFVMSRSYFVLFVIGLLLFTSGFSPLL